MNNHTHIVGALSFSNIFHRQMYCTGCSELEKCAPADSVVGYIVFLHAGVCSRITLPPVFPCAGSGPLQSRALRVPASCVGWSRQLGVYPHQRCFPTQSEYTSLSL